MVNMIDADIYVSPEPTTVQLKPVATNNGAQVKMMLQPLPSMTIDYKKAGGDWSGFNDSVCGHFIDTVGSALLSFATPYLADKGQELLDQKTTFSLPAIPLQLDGVTITLTPSVSSIDVNPNNKDDVMISASVSVS
ncbi:hypothetical protein V8J88_09045 [Massilia sp. W12]|uniref:hypothetical protein n=1 Tax=Massilia sp. W12 TaxID=3126507 RepID=UPI0030D5A77F